MGTRILSHEPQMLAQEGLATFFSRLMLFLGIKSLGRTQTALLRLGELIVSITVSQFWLHKSLNSAQWPGAAYLAIRLLLISFARIKPENRRVNGLLNWLRPPEITTDIPPGSSGLTGQAQPGCLPDGSGASSKTYPVPRTLITRSFKDGISDNFCLSRLTSGRRISGASC